MQVIGRKGFIATRLASPTLSFSNIATTSLTITWTFSTNAVTYLLERSTSVDFSLNLTTVYSGTGNTVNDTGLVSNTTYYYRVKALAIGYIDSAFAADFVTTSGGAGQLPTPSVSRLGIGTTSLSIVWPSISSATGYVVQRATNSTFTSGLTTLYSGNSAGVTRAFQPGYLLEYHDSSLTTSTPYFYRVKATGGGFSDSNWSPTQTWTTGASNRTHTTDGPQLFFIDGGTNQLQVYDIVSNTVNYVYAGDTIALKSPTGGSGLWAYFSLQDFHGTPTQTITIRNEGQVKMTAGFSFQDCSYVTVDGSHPSRSMLTKLIDGINEVIGGFEIYGNSGGECISIKGLSRHIKVQYTYTEGGAYQLRCKNEANSFLSVNPDCGIQYMYPSHIHDIEFAHNIGYEHSQDGNYWGSSAPYGGRPFTCNGSTVDPRPTGLANIWCHDNILAYCGRSAYQLGCLDTGTNRWSNNKSLQTGFEYDLAQGAGFAVGSATNSIEIDHNTIKNSFIHAAYSYSFGLFYYHDNIHTGNIGTIDIREDRTIFWTKIALSGGQTLSNLWMDSSPGRVIKDNLNEYTFEFFSNIGGNPIIKTQRQRDAGSASVLTIPTTFPTAITVNIILPGSFPSNYYTVGEVIRVNAQTRNVWFKGTVTSYNSTTGDLVISATSSSGTGTYYSWSVWRETRTWDQAIAAIGQTAPGSHAGTTADPYVGFGASSAILTSQVTVPPTITIPTTAIPVSNLMMNTFNQQNVTIYGNIDGLTRFRIENNQFGSQQAGSDKVILFLQGFAQYGSSPNMICGNTFIGSALTSGNIYTTGTAVTYTLANTCTSNPYTDTLFGQDNGDNTFNLRWGVNSARFSSTKFILTGIGSSTLAGTGATPPNNLPGYIQSWLTANTSGGQLINMATSGYDSRMFLTEGADSNVKVDQNVDAAIAHKPHAAFISLPTNDIASGLTAAQFTNNVKAIYDQFQAWGIPCFVETPQPRDSFTDSQQQALVDATALFRTTFPAKFLVDIFDLVRDTGSVHPAMINPTYAAGDAIHLNSAGHQVIFNTLQARMNAYFADPNYLEYQVEKSTSSGSGFTLFDTISVGSTIQKNYNRVDATIYYYRVRAKKIDNSYTDYSNVVSLQQPLNVGALSQSIQVNFGNEVDPAPPSDWNNLVGSTTAQMAAGTVFSALKDSTGTVTGVGMTVLKKFNNAIGGGASGSGVYPGNVMRNSWPASGGFNDYSQVKFTGLSNANTYQLEVLTSFATSLPAELAIRAKFQTYPYKQGFEFSANSGVANSTNLITLKGLLANESGELHVDFIPCVANGSGVVSGMVLKKMA
jgi:lysophospholipase L1-like esterase